MDQKGAMFCFSTAEGNKVYVDPNFVAYVERRGEFARIVFSGGFELMVKDEAAGVHEVIRAYKQGEQE